MHMQGAVAATLQHSSQLQRRWVVHSLISWQQQPRWLAPLVVFS
jgi:hypothetical protein